MKALVTLILGLILGAAFTLIGMNYLRKGVSYSSGVMAVLGAKMGAMNQAVKAERCSADDFRPHLNTLAALGNDLEPAFLPTLDDAQFSKYAGDYRAAVDESLASPPNSCEAATVMLNQISATCKACHQDFKN